MRIVGGAFKGRRLLAPEGRDIRPTSDRARESIFNIIAHSDIAPSLEGASAIDVFAGTGALGFEAMSRRAKPVTMGQAMSVTVLRLDATQLPPPPRIAQCPAAFAFVDAPYDSGATGPALLSMLSRGWIGPDSLCIVETDAKLPFEPPRHFVIEDQRTYGVAMVSFLSVKQA